LAASSGRGWSSPPLLFLPHLALFLLALLSLFLLYSFPGGENEGYEERGWRAVGGVGVCG
jgi:hypothetical protein